MKNLIFYLISLIFILAFGGGILEIYGINPNVTQLIIDFLIMMVFSYSLLNIIKNKKIKGPGLAVNFFLFATILISFLVTNVSELQMILFIRKFGIYYLFFYALLNINLNVVQKKKLLKLLMFLFLVQIPAAMIKLITIGTMEDYIGIISIQQGSIASIIPLMAISYLIARYLEFKNNKYLVLILLFISIGLISSKIAILFYLMILFVVLSYFYSLKHTKGFSLINLIFIKKMMAVSVILILIFLSFISLNPRTNPEHKVGGSVDIDFLQNYVMEYQTAQFQGGKIEAGGRFDAPGVAVERLSEGGLLNLLIGFGPGDIVKSSYSTYKDPLLEKYSIGYGGRLGFIWILIQIGIIGVIVFVLFHIYLFTRVLTFYHAENDRESQVLILTVLGISIIYFLDFFTYSSTMLKSSSAAISYYFAMFYVFSDNIEATNSYNKLST